MTDQGWRGFRSYWDRGWPVERPPWGVFEVLLVIVLVFVLLFSLRLFDPYRLAALAAALFPGYSDRTLSLLLLLSLVQTLLIIGLVLGAARLRGSHPLRRLGLQNFNWRSVWLYGILGGVAIFIFIVVTMTLINSLWHQPLPPQEVAYLIGRTNGWRAQLGSLLMSCVLAPLSEELFFRGFAYPVLRSRLGVWPATLIVSCLFGALHYDLARFLPIALGGAFFALACEKTRSLYPAIAAHSTWNILTTLVILLTGSPA